MPAGGCIVFVLWPKILFDWLTYGVDDDVEEEEEAVAESWNVGVIRLMMMAVVEMRSKIQSEHILVYIICRIVNSNSSKVIV